MQKTSIMRTITLRSQGRAETRPVAMRAASLVILVAGAAGTANAQILLSEAYGDQMVGGTVTIEWAGLTSGIVAGTTIAPIGHRVAQARRIALENLQRQDAPLVGRLDRRGARRSR